MIIEEVLIVCLILLAVGGGIVIVRRQVLPWYAQWSSDRRLLREAEQERKRAALRCEAAKLRIEAAKIDLSTSRLQDDAFKDDLDGALDDDPDRSKNKKGE